MMFKSMFGGLVVVVAAGGAAAQSSQYPVHWKSAGHGGILQCSVDEAISGACTSGRDKDCGSYSHRILCHEGEDLFNGGNADDWIEKKHGAWATCGTDGVAVSRCAGGRDEDCKVVNWRTYDHALQCRKLRPNWRLLKDDQEWKCCDHGKNCYCSTGYVVTESCGSGKNNDCDNRGCTGKETYTGLRCTKLVDASDVKFSTNKPDGAKVFMRAARDSDNVEQVGAPGGASACDLQYHSTLSEEPFTITTQYTVQTGYDVVASESKTTEGAVSLAWKNEIGASAGLFSGSFSSEISVGVEWSTQSSTVVTRARQETTTTMIERQFTIPANSFIASANFVVLTTLSAAESYEASRIAFTSEYTNEGTANYSDVLPVSYSMLIDLQDHPNLANKNSCEAFVSELFRSGSTIDSFAEYSDSSQAPTKILYEDIHSVATPACTPTNQCDAGYGNCDLDSDCAGNLVCGSNSSVNVCEEPTVTATHLRLHM